MSFKTKIQALLHDAVDQVAADIRVIDTIASVSKAILRANPFYRPSIWLYRVQNLAAESYRWADSLQRRARTPKNVAPGCGVYPPKPLEHDVAMVESFKMVAKVPASDVARSLDHLPKSHDLYGEPPPKHAFLFSPETSGRYPLPLVDITSFDFHDEIEAKA